MIGVITGRDIFAHPIATIRCFGWRVFFRAILPGREQTFLSLLQDCGYFHEEASQAPNVLDHCIGLELRAKHVYQRFARQFADQESVRFFFAGLAEQEQHHADLLRVCRSIVLRGVWRADFFHPWQEHLPELEQRMADAEAEAAETVTVMDALRLTIRIESSEVNAMFHASLAASRSLFVKRLRPFGQAMNAHMHYLLEHVPALAAELADDCREMEQVNTLSRRNLDAAAPCESPSRETHAG